MVGRGRLDVRGVRVAFARAGGQFAALDGIDLAVADGEFVAIVGRSGCGKSTLFNVLAGLQAVRAGTVTLDGTSLVDSPGSAGYMMQQDQLFPWRTVLENVALGCDVIGRPTQQTRERARALMARFGLEGREKEYPRALSGGMRQRAALMRTLLLERGLLLLDEPFGALDAITKADMQSWLLDLWDEYHSTVLFITHDVEEALFLADRVIVMAGPPGRIVADVPVPIPRPRDHTAVVTSAEFIALKHTLLDVLKDEAPA